jgi:FtsH-binding integral membrane protein
MNRVDWPFVLVWAALGLLTCMVANVLFWLAQRVLLVIGWQGVVVVVALIGVAGVAMIARKGNPTW